MGNVIHKIVDGDDHQISELKEQRGLLIEETERLNKLIMDLDTKHTRLKGELDHIVTCPDLAIEFVKDQGIDWIEDGFEELQIRKFQAYLKKKREEGRLLQEESLPPPSPKKVTATVAIDLNKSVDE